MQAFRSGCGWNKVATALLVASITYVSSTVPALAQKHRYAPEVEQRIGAAGKLLKEGNFDETRKVLQDAIKMDPACGDAYNNIGISYFREGQLKEAERNFRMALKIDPLYLEALCNLGLCLYQQGESHYDEAIIYFRQALELTHNSDPQLHKNLADVLRDGGDYKEALKHYSEAVKLQPDYAPAYNGLSMLYYRMKNYDQAYAEAQNAVKMRPNYALGYFYLGMIETARKHTPEAIQFYETSLKYEPNPRYASDTRLKISELKAGLAPPSFPFGATTPPPVVNENVSDLVRAQDWGKAENLLERMLSTPSGKTANNYNNYGYVLSRRGKFEQATQAYRNAINLSKGKFPQAHYNLGQALRLNNDAIEAEQEFSTAIHESQKMNKPFPAAYNAYALLLKSRGQLTQANKYYKVALSQAGNSMPVIHYNLGILLEKTEKSRDAVREYKQYLALAPNGKNAKQAKERLKRLTGDAR